MIERLRPCGVGCFGSARVALAVVAVGVVLTGCTLAKSTDETAEQARVWSELPVFDLEIPDTSVVGPRKNVGTVNGDWAQPGYVRIRWKPSKGQTIDVEPIFDSLLASGFERFKCDEDAAGTIDYYLLRSTGQVDQRLGMLDYDVADVTVPYDHSFVKVEVSHGGHLNFEASDEAFASCERDT